MAISIATADSPYLDNAAKFAALLATKIGTNALPANIFLNINVPDLPLAKIKGVKITQLASKSHTDTVEEGHDGKRAYYWLVRQKINKNTNQKTDIWSIEHGNISITPLHTNLLNRSSPLIPESLCPDLFQELQKGSVTTGMK